MRNPDRVATRLHQLKQLGIRLAIDDFGTGYSSLAYLRQFPIDSLKIDRSFITGLGDRSEAQALVHSLVQLGKSLNLDIVAEGIEHDDQLRQLQAESCNHGQGFLLARPLKVASGYAIPRGSCRAEPDRPVRHRWRRVGRGPRDFVERRPRVLQACLGHIVAC